MIFYCSVCSLDWTARRLGASQLVALPSRCSLSLKYDERYGNIYKLQCSFGKLSSTVDTTQFGKQLYAIAYRVDYCLHMYGLYKCVNACIAAS